MSLNPMSAQEYADAQVARYARPDDYPVPGSDGRSFARNRPMRCPICESTFYGYQAVDAPCQPYISDPQPDLRDSSGARRTCGHPTCEASEDREQFRRRLEALAQHHPEGLEPVKIAPARTRPKLQRAGEMGGTR